MKHILESPNKLIHTTSRWSKEQPNIPIIKVNYPFSLELLDYVREMVKLTVLGLNENEPIFKLSNEYPKCKIYEYRVKLPHIVVKYKL